MARWGHLQAQQQRRSLLLLLLLLLQNTASMDTMRSRVQQQQLGQVLLGLMLMGGCLRCHMHMAAEATAAIHGLQQQQQQRQAAGCVKAALQLEVRLGIACWSLPRHLGRAAIGLTVMRSSRSTCSRRVLPRVKASMLAAMRHVLTTALLL
jgi:hypothetical protein